MSVQFLFFLNTGVFAGNTVSDQFRQPGMLSNIPVFSKHCPVNTTCDQKGKKWRKAEITDCPWEDEGHQHDNKTCRILRLKSKKTKKIIEEINKPFQCVTDEAWQLKLRKLDKVVFLAVFSHRNFFCKLKIAKMPVPFNLR